VQGFSIDPAIDLIRLHPIGSEAKDLPGNRPNRCTLGAQDSFCSHSAALASCGRKVSAQLAITNNSTGAVDSERLPS
jgi:hypothetical protein